MASIFERAKSAMARILSAVGFFNTKVAPSSNTTEVAKLGGHFSSRRRRQRGKGKSAHHPARVNRIVQRAALKRRNVLRNRKAHKGPKC
jgi:hypothetical protein